MNLLKISHNPFTSLLAALVFLFASCSTDNGLTTENTISSKSEYKNLNSEEISNIGIKHNQYLGEAFRNFDFDSEEPFAQLKDNFLSIDIPELENEQKRR